MLKGLQLSFVPDIPPYALQNPSVGEAIATSSGLATVTRTEQAGGERIIFADYGSGIEQPHVSEGIRQFVEPSEVKAIAPSGWIQTKDGRNLNPLYYYTSSPEQQPSEPYEVHVFSDGTRSVRTDNPMPGISHKIEYISPEPQPLKRQRRHSPKGKASGTIKERRGNTKRDRPSISYYYEWLEKGKKRSIYIPSRQVGQVRAMIDRRCSVDEILSAITKRTKEKPEL
jgi:hypothetical protein